MPSSFSVWLLFTRQFLCFPWPCDFCLSLSCVVGIVTKGYGRCRGDCAHCPILSKPMSITCQQDPLKLPIGILSVSTCPFGLSSGPGLVLCLSNLPLLYLPILGILMQS